MRIGVPANYYFDGLHPEVDRAVREAIRALGGWGTTVETLRGPDPEPMVAACNNTMVMAEAASIHSRILKERPGDLQPGVLARLGPGLGGSASASRAGPGLRRRSSGASIAAGCPT